MKGSGFGGAVAAGTFSTVVVLIAWEILGRLFEERLLSASDRQGQPVRLRSALRFGGVGAEDDLS